MEEAPEVLIADGSAARDLVPDQALHRAESDTGHESAGAMALIEEAAFNQTLLKAIGHAERAGDKVAILCLDVDHLKQTSNELPDQASELLRQMAGRLGECLRKGDTVGRLSGDRLGIIAEGLKNELDAQIVSDRIHSSLAKPFQLEQRVVNGSISVGLAVYPDDGDEVEQLAARAVNAMLRAREHGFNRSVFYNAEIDRNLNRLRKMRGELETAIEKRQCQIKLKPRFHTPGRHIHSFGSVIQWHDQKHALLDEPRFLQFVQDSGLVVEIDKLILETVILQLATWKMEETDIPRVSMKVSSKHFRSDSLPQMIADMCRSHAVPPASLEISFSEAVLLEYPGEAIEVIRQLAEVGVKMSIFDFGGGYCALHYLRQLPVDMLNIHHTLVADLESSKTAALVRSLITLAHNLGFLVAAGRIENEKQSELLCRFGCDVLWGPLLAAPVPAEEALSCLGAFGDTEL